MNEPEKTDDQSFNDKEVGKESIDWLKDIASKSFEPELLISGAGIYLASALPDVIEWAYDYYVANLIIDTRSSTAVLFSLIYAFLKSNAYVLAFTFLFHFIMRAFWVGMVGLLSVYPKGIDYENLSNRYSDFFKEKAQKELGSTESFILRLDKICSIIFSVAFLFIMLFVGICFLYFVVILFFELARLVLPNQIIEQHEIWFFFSFMGLILIPSSILMVLQLPFFQNDPKWAKTRANLQWIISVNFIPLLGIVIFRLSLIFQSQIIGKGKWKWILYIVFLILFMFSSLLFHLLYKRWGEIWNTRNYFSSGSEYYQIDNNLYENLRQSDKSVLYLTIQADVIKDSYIKLFLAYPKRLDKRMKQTCSFSAIDKKLDKEEYARQIDTQRLDCFAQYFKIYVNDSLYRKPDFVFFKHPDTYEKGVLTYLPTKNFKLGKNYLKIIRPQVDNPKKNTTFYVVPFWYAPSGQN